MATCGAVFIKAWFDCQICAKSLPIMANQFIFRTTLVTWEDSRCHGSKSKFLFEYPGLNERLQIIHWSDIAVKKPGRIPFVRSFTQEKRGDSSSFTHLFGLIYCFAKELEKKTTHLVISFPAKRAMNSWEVHWSEYLRPAGAKAYHYRLGWFNYDYGYTTWTGA